ncbi:hypothetical protein PBY51_009283 [Eleginops maclovinus]|uniref:Uncharacterized protein n=1 Tax=Eleginops maclovinus TaxID=56733 RepID=A0AAN7XVW8_ELEMC|nr:hypothetical protein PBY51_009283 [Eleginops maclovinus]
MVDVGGAICLLHGHFMFQMRPGFEPRFSSAVGRSLSPCQSYFPSTSCSSGFSCDVWRRGERSRGPGVLELVFLGCSATFVSPAVNLAHYSSHCSPHELGVRLSGFLWQPRLHEMICWR